MRFLLALAGVVLFGALLFRRIVRTGYLKGGGLSFLSSLLELLIFLVHANLMYLFIPVAWPSLPPLASDAILYWPSLVLILIGLSIVLGALIPLGYRRAMGVEATTLKTDGFYRFTRNPQIMGYYLILIGFAVSYPSVYAAAWIAGFGVIAHLMIITEEEYLSKEHREQYGEYMKRVPRYLGARSFFGRPG